MSKVAIVFPHQLFKDVSPYSRLNAVYLVEESLFFNQYKFHQQKIAYHRATMKFYEDYLKQKGIAVQYIESTNPLSDIQQLLQHLSTTGINHITYTDTTDNWLQKRITTAARNAGIVLHQLPSPLFLTTLTDLKEYFAEKRFFQTDFYIHQRKRWHILTDGKTPVGGKWSYDADNRLRYPRNQTPPPVHFPEINSFYIEAQAYTQQHFTANPGQLSKQFIYPATYQQATDWLNQFLQYRFHGFGVYEDAIVAQANILHHSVLTPMLNIGLLTPAQVVDAAIDYAVKENVPLNSLEGFVRQVIGWREFIRAVYELKGTAERTRNYWGFKRKIPPSFWNGTTGIVPVDSTIRKVLRTGYCHHIERLMILGNFMLLCEFDPDEVYRWFMEMFIDAYDWVMVPNVYGMSQFADGGIMSTKPYISGSNYVLKMSDYEKGEWCEIWDALFWRFIHTQRSFFLQNPRMGMMVKTFDKMDAAKQQKHLDTADRFLGQL